MRIDQWPQTNKVELTVKILKSFFYLSKGRKVNINFIEEYFEDKFKMPVALKPSGRNSIHSILKLHNISRKDQIYITKFSSFCVYQATSSLGETTTEFRDPKVTIINHKWGNTNTFEFFKNNGAIVIEDSCDSFLLSQAELFINNGTYEIISLSKILGAISGGIIIINKNSINKNKSEFFNISRHKSLSYVQLIRKFINVIFPNKEAIPLAYEYLNSYVNAFEAALIRSYISDYEFKLNLLKDRKKRIYQIFNKPLDINSRIGPGIVLLLDEINVELIENSLPIGILIRNFDISLSNDAKLDYRRVLYVPTHYNVDSSLFEIYIKFIKKYKNQILKIF
jgi:putative PLP-dependent aminotransferase (TIGR04422 family)